MTVSIVMPYYNASKYIFETVDSILAQTEQNWELIIVDDCSPEPETNTILGKLIEMDSRIHAIQLKQNGGAGLARNAGIKSAQGRYLAFCDADDWWYPTKLEEQLKFMEDNGYEFSCSYYEDANENLEPYYTVKQPEKMSRHDLISGCSIGTPGVIIDTNRIGKLYMPNLRRAEDWGMWLKVLEKVDYIYSYPKVLWKYRHIHGSTSSNKLKQAKAVIAMYKDVLKYNYIQAFGTFWFIFLPKNLLSKFKKKTK
ncbi:glycosyltransferase family 2 protein [Bacteroides bouchesdurhonensis]|uniref:glycosyltransferase family 2 protein n=1 Tax=Bacteroides bouchesdurhonensis TaxID=1841855 RepID=UPI0011DCEB2C|nr:glycosyltransferase family 2 protein [Bacteroides bouchesdurhonensis]